MVKIFASLLAATFMVSLANAASVQRNCFDKNNAEFFTHELAPRAPAPATPVLLLNANDQVVGVISVMPERAEKYPFKAKNVVVGKVSLCSSLQVSEFFYPGDGAENLLAWSSAPNGAVSFLQDEGMIVIEAQVSQTSEGARVDAKFKAYDVFENEELTDTEKTSQDYLADWGLPKGTGSFHFFLPSNWKL
jgi:hypothetical protein